MASLENGINGDYLREHADPTGTAGDFTDLEAELKMEKFRAKSNFTRSKNKVLFLIDQPEKPGYRKIQEACNKMDNAKESATTRHFELFGKIRKNR